MPLDPRIALGTQGPQMRSPLATLGAVTELRDRQEYNRQRQLMNEQKQRDLDDDSAIRDALTRTNNPDRAIDDLYQQGRSSAAGVLSKNLFDHRKAVADEADKKVKTQKEQVDFATRILDSAHDQASWDTARTAAQTILAPELFQHVPPAYDPAKQKELVSWGMTASEKMTAQQNAIENANKAWDLSLKQAQDWRERQKGTQDAREHWTKAASSLLSSSHSQEEWDGNQRLLAGQGAPVDLLAEFGNQFSPESITRAKQLGMTPHEAEGVRQRDRELKIQQQNADNRETGTGGAPARGLTPNRISEIDEWAARQYSGLEKEIRENPANDRDGKFQLDESSAADLAQRKLAIEDQARKMKGMPPLLETEASLIDQPGKEKDLRKIRNVYKRLTGQETPAERMKKLVAELQSEKDPAKVSALRKQLADLRAHYPSAGR